MRKIFISITVFVLLCLISSKTSFAERYATCDACGLCPKIDVENGTCTVNPNQVPGDWKDCAKCLYGIPKVSAQPGCDTLIINSDNTPKKPMIKGSQFTQLGCISTGTNVGFNTQTGAPSFVQALLNVIFSLAGGAAFLYLMYGAFIVLTSQADPERLNYGKRLIYGAIAGLIITVASVFIVNIIGSGILRIPGFAGAI